MGNEIAVELVGLVRENEWMGFGVSGSTTSTYMLGADPTVVDMYNGTYRARDFYLINRSQCSGVSGVCPDTRNGKTDDVKVGSVSGERDQGITLVRYIRPLTPTDVNDSLPSDSRFDRSILGCIWRINIHCLGYWTSITRYWPSTIPHDLSSRTGLQASVWSKCHGQLHSSRQQRYIDSTRAVPNTCSERRYGVCSSNRTQWR
jgi:DOMON domain